MPRTPNRRAAHGPVAVPRKKTVLLDQGLLDRARQALGARTETAAIAEALTRVVQREQQIQGLRRLARIGPIDPTRID
jgi:hypothetical protein